jgi:16S rRNA (guanine527-N7)-methyltransferase
LENKNHFLKPVEKSSDRPLRKNDNPPDLTQEEGRQYLKAGARAMGVLISDLQLSLFMDYLSLLQKWNRIINLTGLQTQREIIVKHFLDSLTLLPLLPNTFSLMDLGSGGGFPGLPIRIMAPDQKITLVEASAKKVSFLRDVIRRLAISDVSVIHIFLGPDASALPGNLRKPFDIITSRAVGQIGEIMRSADPFLGKGGKLILMKGKKGREELEEAVPQIGHFDFKLEKIVDLKLPLTDLERTLIVFTKID